MGIDSTFQSFASNGIFGSALMGPATGMVSFNFLMLAGMMPVGQFFAAEGLGFEHHTYEYKELGTNNYTHRLWAGTDVTTITLKWGLVHRNGLYAWASAPMMAPFSTSMPRSLFRFPITLLQYNRRGMNGPPSRVYFLKDAWCSKWMGSNIDSNTSDVAVEQIDVQCEKLYTIATYQTDDVQGNGLTM